MELSYIQWLYIGVVTMNLVMLAFLLIRTRKPKNDRQNRGRNDNDSNDEGGLEEDFDPVLDLPPGVILPTDAPKKEKETVS